MDNETATVENGDLFDEDLGEHLATIDLFTVRKDGTAENKESPPASLSLFFNGFWYVYKIDSRYKEEEEELPAAAAP